MNNMFIDFDFDEIKNSLIKQQEETLQTINKIQQLELELDKANKQLAFLEMSYNKTKNDRDEILEQLELLKKETNGIPFINTSSNKIIEPVKEIKKKESIIDSDKNENKIIRPTKVKSRRRIRK